MRQRIAILVGSVGLGLLLTRMIVPEEKVNAGSTPVTRGAELFASKGCVHCHGPAGVGGDRGPDLQLVRKRMAAEAMARQIHDGGREMPAFGDALTAGEIEDLVAYLRAKRKFVTVHDKPSPPADPR